MTTAIKTGVAEERKAVAEAERIVAEAPLEKAIGQALDAPEREGPEEKETVVVKATPGFGKSYTATVEINKRKAPVAYCVGSHDLEDSVPHREKWKRLYGHNWKNKDGQRKFPCPDVEEYNRLVMLGYSPKKSECDCGYAEQFIDMDTTTIMPLDYAFKNDRAVLRYKSGSWLNVGKPQLITQEIGEFKKLVIDELSLDRFTGKMFCPAADFACCTLCHPSPEVKKLSAAMCKIMEGVPKRRKYERPKLGGAALLAQLEEELGSEFLKSLSEEVEGLPWEHQPGCPFYDQEKLPHNWPAYLIPILLWEQKQSKRHSGEWNPRIHVYHDQVHILWRREARQPDLILDATIDDRLLETMGWKTSTYPIDMPMSPIVHIRQYTNERGGMNAIQKALPKWDARLRDVLDPFSRDIKLRLVCRKKFKMHLLELVTEMGFKDVKAEYYDNLRSKNTLEDAEVMVLLGAPIPNPEALEAAQAFYFNCPKFESTKWTQQWKLLKAKNGDVCPVRQGGYHGDQRLASFLQQMCEYELYHAVHRARPVRPNGRTRLDIIILTNNAIPGVEPDELIVEGDRLRMQKAVQILLAAKEKRERVYNTELVKALGVPNNWCGAHRKMLSEVTGMKYVSVRGSSGSYFESSS